MIPRKQNTMREKFPTARSVDSLLAVLAVLAVAGCQPGKTKTSGNERGEPRAVYALGRLEPATGVISVSAVPGERLKSIDPDVAVNQRVPANGVLGLLASYDLGKAQLQALHKKLELAQKNRVHQLEVAKAQKAQAEASLAQAQAKLKELELQGGKLQSLAIASQLAEQEYSQLEVLHLSDPELVTEYQLRKQRNAMDMAAADYAIASEGYPTSKAAAEKAVAAAQANISVAELSLTQLEQAYEEQAIEQEIEVAEESLKRSVLLAPDVSPETLHDVLDIRCVADHPADSSEGRGAYTVLKTYLQPGEFITQTPILQLGDLSSMVCLAEVYEADVKNLKSGAESDDSQPRVCGQVCRRHRSSNEPENGGDRGARDADRRRDRFTRFGESQSAGPGRSERGRGADRHRRSRSSRPGRAARGLASDRGI